MTLLLSNRSSSLPGSIPSWLLKRLIRCDEALPGTLRRYYTGSDWRRQCIALILSELDPDQPESLAARLRHLSSDEGIKDDTPLATVSRLIVRRRIRDLVRALHPRAVGLAGTIRRLGGDVLSADEYRVLISLHVEQEHSCRLDALRLLPEITSRSIKVVMALQAPYVTTGLVKRLWSTQQVDDFHASIELIKRITPDVTDADLLASLQYSLPTTHISDWVRRWLRRASIFLDNLPFDDDDEFVVLNSACSIRAAARRYENCLEGLKLIPSALGRECFIEHVPSRTLVGLRVLDRGFVLEGFYGPSNTRVEPDTVSLIIKLLQARGILIPARLSHPLQNRVARIGRIIDLTRDELELFEPPLDLEPELPHAA